MIDEPPFPIPAALAALRDELNAAHHDQDERAAAIRQERGLIEAATLSGTDPKLGERIATLKIEGVRLSHDGIALRKRIIAEWWPAAKIAYRAAIDRAEEEFRKTRDFVDGCLRDIGYPESVEGRPAFRNGLAIQHPDVAAAQAKVQSLRFLRFGLGDGVTSDPVTLIERDIARREEEHRRKTAALVG